MGNQHSNDHKSSEDFIIKLHRQQVRNSIICNSNDQLFDPRRVVFVSLIGLYQTWSLCPTHILYPSIFILPLNKKWIYSPKKYKNEISKNILGHMTIFQDNIAFNQFLCLLKWKDTQNLLFCMLDYEKIEMGNEKKNVRKIGLFWEDFSCKLTDLYDPITKSKYNPIKLNAKWWMYNYNVFKSNFNVPAFQILRNLYFVTMNFKSMQEIIYQSNPKSLKPIVAYNSYKNVKIIKPQIPNGFIALKNNKNKFDAFISFKTCCPDIDDDEQQSDNAGIWMISTEYNEYDLE